MKKNYFLNSKLLSLLGLCLIANKSNAQCPTPSSVMATPPSICIGGTSNINATAGVAAINWYTVPTGGTPIGTSASGANYLVNPTITTTYYAESFQNPVVGGTTTFTYTGAIQNYTVPASVTQLTITATGASGGSISVNCSAIGGRGARVSGVFTVTPGQVLAILVGQKGFSNGSDAGGGGGSFVVATPSTALLVAGGGGGASNNITSCGSNLIGIDATLTTSATASGNGLVAGGINGNGGGASTGSGGGGGGFFTNGAGGSGTPASGGKSFFNGGIGGTGNNNDAGGFGGGGAGWFTGGNGGGGGGYSGGGTSGSQPFTGGGGGSSFNAGTNQVNTAAVGLGDGTITIVAQTIVGCTSAQRTPITLTINPNPTIIVNSGVLCSGNSFTISPSGASTYTISGGSSVVSPTANASYSVTGTSPFGCVSSNTAVSSITVAASPTVVVNSGTICSGNSFTIIPSGANTYTVQGGTNIVSPSASTSYTVRGTNLAGCVSANTATSNVTVNAQPTISINNGAICAGNSYTLTPSGAITYTISGGASVVTPTSSSSYSIAGTGANGCIGNTISSVTVNASPTISANSGVICAGNSFTIIPSGASTYTIGGGSSVVTPTANSSYNVVGTSAQGCVGSNTAVSSVTVNPLPTISATSTNSLLCFGSTASLTASGANTYTWNTSANTSVIAVSPTITTTYTIIGTNTNGCNNGATITQSVSPCTGINNLASIATTNVLAFPNPSNGLYTIQNTSGTKIEITVVNALGQIVLNKTISSENEIINLKEQANGIYYLKAGDRIVKLIKQQ